MTHIRHKLTWSITLALLFALILASLAMADDISNNLDASVDAVAEIMSLNVGGAAGTTKLYVNPSNGDGKNGCNLTGSTTLVVSVSSSDTSVATVSPDSITFGSCGDTPTLTITPHNQGSATISLSQTSNSTAGTFDLAPATFTVNVAPPPNTPPQVSITGVTGGDYYEIGSVPVAMCEVTDAEDGNSSFPASLSAIDGPLAAYGLGGQTASCSYTDEGGLTASASVTYGIVDTTAPVITFVSRTSANSFGWNNGDVTVEWSCSDSGSGVVADSVSETITIEGADQSATGTCEDHAGNTASDTQTGINIDKTPPTASASAAPDPNGNGWNNSDVTVSFEGTDGLSGIDTCSDPVVLSSEEASQSASGTCTDKAGNVSDPATVSGINIDKTKPVVEVTGVTDGATYILGSVPAAGCSTSDGLSGVATFASLSLSGGPVGSITATCDGAADKAGNTGSAIATYLVVYDWDGFFRPVDNLPTLNIAKAGSAIPVKFSLSGNQGLGIIANGYPVSRVIACDAAAVTDSIEETLTAGNSSLSYDALADQYIYVWKTEKAWAGTCRQFSMKLNDTQTYSFNVKFNK